MSQRRAAAFLFLIALPLPHQEQTPPNFLLIAEEQLRPNTEARYSKIESTTARMCSELKCPNPYLALVSDKKPVKILWLNELNSAADSQRVAAAYASNKTLMATLNKQVARKKPLVLPVIVHWARYRSDLSQHCSWNVGIARYYVVQSAREKAAFEGCVFESTDGWRFAIVQRRTRADAQRLMATAGTGAAVFTPRPSWSYPADAWISGAPEFWRTRTRIK